MKHRVCLVIPPSAFLLDERVFMSLGVLKVAAMLETHGVDVDMLDLSGIENYAEVVRDYARARGVDCFGITATTPQMPAAKTVRDAIKEERPLTRIILGGPHVTLVSAAEKLERKRSMRGRGTDALYELSELFDVLVAGDGEFAVFHALEEYPSKLIDGDDPKTELFLPKEILGDLPFPARHLVDVGSYHYSIDGVPALSLIAQLGCPFECGFCGGRASPSLRRIRIRSSESVVAEMRSMYNAYGVKGFMLYDDELNVNPKMVEMMDQISALQAELGLQFRLRGFIKAELFTIEQARAMYRAGFRWILVGFESGHPDILESINKKAALEDNTRCMEIAKEAGLKVKALMSVGHPGETEETVRATRDWLLAVRPDDFDATVITTYPGTPYFDEAVPGDGGIWTYTFKKTGARLHSSDVDFLKRPDYYKGIPGEYVSRVWTDELSAEDIVRLRDWLEEDVRGKLGIPFNASAAAQRYEHSMGQGAIPTNILRSTKGGS